MGPGLAVSVALALLPSAALVSAASGRAARRLAVAALAASALLLGYAAASSLGVLVLGKCGCGGLLAYPRGALMAASLGLAASSLLLASMGGCLDERSAPLLLLAAAGGLVVLGSTGLIQLLLGVEAAAFSLAAVVAYSGAVEAAVKYLYTSIYASALLVLGAAISASSGGMCLHALGSGVAGMVGAALVVAALGAEAGLAPFYMWLPDYASAAPVAALAVSLLLVDVPVIVALYRVAAAAEGLAPVLLIIGLGSIALGELAALAQEKPRRMLGYAMVGDAGYVALLAAYPSGSPGLAAYYVLASNLVIAFTLAALEEEKGIGLFTALGLAGLTGMPPLPLLPAKVMLVAWLARRSLPVAALAALFFLVAAAYPVRAIARGATAARPRGRRLVWLALYLVIMLAVFAAPTLFAGGW